MQRLLTLLNDTQSIKSQRNSLMQLARSLLTKAPPQQLSYTQQLTPLQRCVAGSWPAPPPSRPSRRGSPKWSRSATPTTRAHARRGDFVVMPLRR